MLFYLQKKIPTRHSAHFDSNNKYRHQINWQDWLKRRQNSFILINLIVKSRISLTSTQSLICHKPINTFLYHIIHFILTQTAKATYWIRDGEGFTGKWANKVRRLWKRIEQEQNNSHLLWRKFKSQKMFHNFWPDFLVLFTKPINILGVPEIGYWEIFAIVQNFPILHFRDTTGYVPLGK